MSHPDPTRDYDDFDMMAEQTIWPWIDDESHDRDDANYDDHDDFFCDGEDFDDSMDGDAESAFGACGWGVDEYYNPDNDYGDDW